MTGLNHRPSIASGYRTPIYGVGIDPGAAQTRCVIVAAGEDDVHHVGSAMVESSGWKRGMVLKAGLVAERIRAALEKAAYGIPLRRAVFGGNMDDPGLADAIVRSGIGVESRLESVVAAAVAVLQPDEWESRAIIDLGAQHTGIGLWRDDTLELGSIPVGGEHFSRDVATCMALPYEKAETMKHESGRVWLRPSDTHTLFVEILEARGRELARFVASALRGFSGEMVLVGAGAELGGLADLLEEETLLPARFGLPIGNWPEELQRTAWSTAIGLALYSTRIKRGG